MKIINRIAPFLLALALGLLIFPRVQAIEITDDTLQKPVKSKSTRNFYGLRIDPKLVDELLFFSSSAETTEKSSGIVLYTHQDQGIDEVKQSGELSQEDKQLQERYYSKQLRDGKCNKSKIIYKH